MLATSEGEAAYKAVEKLLDAGHEVWWIGGAVRDMLLGLVPREIDMATSALPREIAKIFPRSDVSSADLGTVIISLSGATFEVTTFREDDLVSDGRHPESVKFGSREKDALRRDATINAMYWNPVTRELFDPCGGEADLKESLVRFIGDADLRIQHDALRILRMIRLRALLAGQYHPQTYTALKNNAALTAGLSGMRILQELEKLLKVQKPSMGLEDWYELGILKSVLPELEACKAVPQPQQYHQEGDVWNHLKASADAASKEDFGADVRLAGLFHDIGKAVTFSLQERIRFDHHAQESARLAGMTFKRLQMPGDRIRKIQWIIEHHMMMGTFADLSDNRKAHWYFHPWFQELLQLFWIDVVATTPSDPTLYDTIIADYNEFLNTHPRPEKPLLNGEEVMQILGLKPGEKVGQIVEKLHAAQVSKTVTTKKEAKAFLLSLQTDA